MKTIITLMVAFIACGLYAQRSQKPWHNHENYKEEVIEAIRQSPELLNPIDYFDVENVSQNSNQSNAYQTNIPEFVNGINIAWVSFGKDVGKDPEFGTEYHPDLDTFGLVMDKVANAGGNVLRWWYHTNGSTNPVYDEQQKVTNNPTFFHEDVIKILDLAASKGLQIQICLWSFDMLKDQWNVDAVANKKLLTEDEYFKAYLDNSLIPLVQAVGEHPGLYAWEIFNEAEGMTTEFGSHWPGFVEKVSIVDIQKFINKAATAIRGVAPNVKITNGALGFLTSLNDADNGYQNYYSDQKLEDIGGESNGYLDFYNIHYYNWAGENGSPFHAVHDLQKIDKEAVIAEYYPDYTFGLDVEQLGVILKENGWHGSLVWSWTDRSWESMEPIMMNVVSYVLSNPDVVYDHSSKIMMTPNPVSDIIKIHGISKKTTIQVRDVTGKEVFSTVMDRSLENSINLEALQKGVYYVILDSTVMKRIVKV
ncbi:T9SS type A sorting domain-containing protein [Aquimarina litoralis]|uniref:T9SS type A sorting domain-containing protein n=1 Tax=Aquimarina litoralis TaxID=584605 RepID=UPI001C583B43|nr:T9SS type A sorting domain-containing protein [Aquimarina litoralis]MBW1296125.1 T9SS type A sorting domain-containing protein [Aquimarina litoralis]